MIQVEDHAVAGAGCELYQLDAAVFARHPQLEVLVRPATAGEAEEDVPTTLGELPTRLVAIVRLADGRLCRVQLPVRPTPAQALELADAVRSRFAGMN